MHAYSRPYVFGFDYTLHTLTLTSSYDVTQASYRIKYHPSMITDVMQAPGHRVESIHTMLSDIYSALDPLRDLFEDLKYDYPQVMVLGNEKAGIHEHVPISWIANSH